MTIEELQRQPLVDPLTHPVWKLRVAYAAAFDDYQKAIRELSDLDLLRLYSGTVKLDLDRKDGLLASNDTPETELDRILRNHAWHLNDECEERKQKPYDPVTHPMWNVRVALDTTCDACDEAIKKLSDDDLFLLLNSVLKKIGWDYYELMFAGQRLHGGMPRELEEQLRWFAYDLDNERQERPALLANWELAAFFPDLPQCPGEPQYELDDDGSITAVFTESDYVPLEALEKFFQNSADQLPVTMKTKRWTATLYGKSVGVINAPTREGAESILKGGLEALRMPRSFVRTIKLSEQMDE